MPFIFRYFWFFCAAMMALNIAIWRHRLQIAVSRGTATQGETSQFLQGAAAYLIGIPVLLGVIGLGARWTSPFCAGLLQFDTLPRALTSGVMIVAWLAFLVWVWQGNGADVLARIGPALSQRPNYERKYSTRTVRTFATGAVLISAVGAPLVWRTMPITPLTCPATLAVG